MSSPADSFEVIMLIKEIYSSMNNQIAASMKESGLTPQQIMVTKIIAHNNEVTISKLCEELSLAKATVSGIIQRLEDGGYVTKFKKEDDKRNTYVIFSDKGNEFAKAFHKDMNHSFCKIFNHLSEEEMVMIKGSLKLLSEKMNQNE